MAGSPLAGTQARLVIANTNINHVKWSINTTALDVKTTNFESVSAVDGQTYEEGITSIRSAEVSFEGMWDTTGQLPDMATPVVEGAIISNVVLYLEKSSTIFITFTSLRILSFKVDAEVDSTKPIWVSITGKTNGRIVWP